MSVKGEGGCPEDKDTKISAVKQSVVRKNSKDLGPDWL